MDDDRPPLDAARLHALVPGRWIRVVETIGSTNETLLALADAPDGAVLVAERQEAGRGRLQRTWVSPARAGLLFSVLLRPSPPAATWAWLPLLTGVALARAVAATTGVAVALKWPNDLMVAATDEKLAGVLAQTSADKVVLGVGLNVSTRREELPVPTATSLVLAGARSPLDRAGLLAAVLGELDRELLAWSDAGGDAVASGVLSRYREVCATVGREVLVRLADGAELRGRASAVEADGRLSVLTADGVRSVAAGDVEHVRPAP